MVAAGKWISPPVGTTNALAVARAPYDDVGRRCGRQIGLQLPTGPAALGGGGQPPDRRDLAVEVLARAQGRRRVAVAVDGLEPPLGDPLVGRRGIDAVQRELPGEQRGVGLDHRLAGLGDLVVADRRGGEGVVVVTEGVRTDDRAVDPAVPALPDPPEPVDQVVVADVAPAAGLHVVGVDAAQQGRHLGARVVVGVHGVVHEARVDVAVVQRGLAADLLVGAPLLAGVDHRLGGERRGGEGGGVVGSGARRAGVAPSAVAAR